MTVGHNNKTFDWKELDVHHFYGLTHSFKNKTNGGQKNGAKLIWAIIKPFYEKMIVFLLLRCYWLQKKSHKPLLQSKGVGRKIFREEDNEKRPKIALLSLYLLYLYHAWKSREATAPLCRRLCFRC